MVNTPPDPSRAQSHQEREFWDREFHDPPAPPPRGGPTATAPSGPPRRRLEPSRAHLAGSILDRFHEWRGDARFGVVVLIVIALVAGFIWYQVGVGGAGADTASPTRGPSATIATTPRDSTDPAPADGADGAPSSSDTTPSAGASPTAKVAATKIAVHVAGAVVHPGVVELRAGARVIDAVEAVGGAQPDADLDRLNLAAKLSDGQRVYVAKVGQTDPGVVDGSGNGEATAGSGSGSTSTLGGKLDLNTATEAQLEQLPGIGPVYAQAIIAERERLGRFKSVSQLRNVRGIGDRRFEQLAPLVTV